MKTLAISLLLLTPLAVEAQQIKSPSPLKPQPPTSIQPRRPEIQIQYDPRQINAVAALAEIGGIDTASGRLIMELGRLLQARLDAAYSPFNFGFEFIGQDAWTYRNGSSALRGSLWFYSNGNLAYNGLHWYYPFNRLASDGINWFYPSGNLASDGNSTWYPNGRTATIDNLWWYPNGVQAYNGLRSFYPDGRLADDGSCHRFIYSSTASVPLPVNFYAIPYPSTVETVNRLQILIRTMSGR